METEDVQINEYQMGGECSTHMEMIDTYKIWAENLKGRDDFGRLRHRWKDNINIDLKERG
jgi:hypothetical protein